MGPSRRSPPQSWAALSVLLSGGDTTGIDLGDGGDPTPEVAHDLETTVGSTAPRSIEAGLREIQVGQCFDTIDDPVAADRAVWVLDCDTAHTHEVFDVVTYEGEGAGRGTSYPGVATVQDWSEQACYDRFEAFVGVRWTLSALDIAVWWPGEESWARADRTVICTVMSDTGDALTGTQRGVGR